MLLLNGLTVATTGFTPFLTLPTGLQAEGPANGIFGMDLVGRVEGSGVSQPVTTRLEAITKQDGNQTVLRMNGPLVTAVKGFLALPGYGPIVTTGLPPLATL